MRHNLNKFSKNLTQKKQNASAQAMLYGLGLTKKDLEKPQIGIGTVWFEGNPCNSKLDVLSDKVKTSLKNKEFLGMRFNTVGVSDGKTMGTDSMRFSLPSRELITDSIETMITAEHYDGCILIPGCDKNLPAAAMALARVNRPGFIIYGGSMRPSSKVINGEFQSLDIVSSFEAYGRYIKGEINDNERENIIQNACHKNCGSCSGFYTANTMACLLEVMGLTLPNSSSNMSLSSEKYLECENSFDVINNLLTHDIKPLDIMTKESFINAIKFLTIIGGSTNGIIHLLAMAKTAKVDLSLDDFKNYEYLPVLTNMKPHGIYVMNDLYKIGGTSLLIKFLIDQNILNGNCLTVTGKTLFDNVKYVDKIDFSKNIILSKESPFKKNSHINILFGNLAPNGCVSKIYSENLLFSGKAKVFDNQEDMLESLEKGEIKSNNFIILRYQGESIGCPEMLTPTSALVGYFNSRGKSSIPPFATDGRFSGGSTGVLVAHLPDAYKKTITSVIQDNDLISIDMKNNSITIDVSEDEIKKRLNKVVIPELKLEGYLEKYRKLVTNLDSGYLT